MIKSLKKSVLKKAALFLAIFLLGGTAGYGYFSQNQFKAQLVSEKNTPKAFLGEVYDKIKENYWDNITDEQLIDLFKQASQKEGILLPAKIEGKETLISNLLEANPDQVKITAIVGTTLASLQPLGRSGLYTQKQETELKNTVQNIDPQKDLYKDLGLTKGASKGEIEGAYQKKAAELKGDTSAQSEKELKKITYARDVLTKDDQKQKYDSLGVEPAIFTKVISANTLYLQFKKFSPSSFEEFVKAFDAYNNEVVESFAYNNKVVESFAYKNNSSLSGLILDLRGNVGGAIDATAYFLGLFLGKNQYAFDFYHKGEYEGFKTPTEKLPVISKFKQIVVLVDGNTQSSAEMMAAAFKKYHLGIILGTPTKGWGTVERVFPLNNQISDSEKYSIFLVHSITLREDNLPIEGRGVEPDINIKSADWEDQLFSYFRNRALAEDIKNVL